jgi:hypothetical protein
MSVLPAPRRIGLQTKNQKVFVHSGTTFDSFLEEKRILKEVDAVAIKRVIARQLSEAMKAGKVGKEPSQGG